MARRLKIRTCPEDKIRNHLVASNTLGSGDGIVVGLELRPDSFETDEGARCTNECINTAQIRK